MSRVLWITLVLTALVSVSALWAMRVTLEHIHPHEPEGDPPVAELFPDDPDLLDRTESLDVAAGPLIGLAVLTLLALGGTTLSQRGARARLAEAALEGDSTLALASRRLGRGPSFLGGLATVALLSGIGAAALSACRAGRILMAPGATSADLSFPLAGIVSALIAGGAIAFVGGLGAAGFRRRLRFLARRAVVAARRGR